MKNLEGASRKVKLMINPNYMQTTNRMLIELIRIFDINMNNV